MGSEAGSVRAVAILERAQLRIAMLALTVMMLTTVAEVLLRYVFGRPIHGAYDVVEVCLAIFVFNGAATVFYRGHNIVIDVIDNLVSERAAHLLVRFGEAAMLVALLLVLWAMISPALQAYDYGDRKLELGLPTYVIWIFATFGVAGTSVCALSAMRRRLPVHIERSNMEPPR